MISDCTYIIEFSLGFGADDPFQRTICRPEVAKALVDGEFSVVRDAALPNTVSVSFLTPLGMICAHVQDQTGRETLLLHAQLNERCGRAQFIADTFLTSELHDEFRRALTAG